MLPDGRRLGAHLPLGHGMVRAAERARVIGASAIQVFADNPTSWRRRDGLPRELPRFKRLLAEADVRPLSIHAPYLVNLAGDDEDFGARSVAVLAHELEVGAAFGAAFVNVHIGSHRGSGVDAGSMRVATAIAQVQQSGGSDDHQPMLVLENSSGGGFGLGVNVEELGRIDLALAEVGVDRRRVGWCLDTAHAWGAGIDVGNRRVVDDFLSEFDRRIGLARLVLVHVNDSRSELGSRSDRHEHLGAGRIGTDGLRRVLTHPALAHAAYILETPGMDEGYDLVNLERARDIVAGRPLAELPTEAFHVGSARARSAPSDEIA